MMEENNEGLTPSEENVFKGKGYKLLNKLGEGAYSKVFLGEFKPANSNKKIKLACKAVDTETTPKKFVNKFFPRELEIITKLNHPHIIHIHSIFQIKSRYFIFMRCAEKGDLLGYTSVVGAIPQEQARIWIRQLALALQYLHTLEIVHRDLKCENILLTSNLNVKLSDFGFARYAVNENFVREKSTTFCGSLAYVAPEVLKGQPYNPKMADMWSLGIILYTMLNNANPFSENETKALYKKQVTRNWKYRGKYIKFLCEEVKQLISHLMEPEIWKRYNVEQVIGSSFIAMDPNLKTLNAAELAALTRAIEESRARRKAMIKSEVDSTEFDEEAKESVSKLQEELLLSDTKKSIGHSIEKSVLI